MTPTAANDSLHASRISTDYDPTDMLGDEYAEVFEPAQAPERPATAQTLRDASHVSVSHLHGNRYLAVNTTNGHRYIVRLDIIGGEYIAQCLKCEAARHGMECQHEKAVKRFERQRVNARLSEWFGN